MVNDLTTQSSQQQLPGGSRNLVDETVGLSKPKRKVIIVGAGVSGLQAAAVLLNHGVEVIVLEARDRIGGRILTNRDGADTLDLGAAWMHGTSYNPLVKLIARLGIDYYYDDGSPLYFTEFGPSGPQFKARNVADEFLDYLSYWLQREPHVPDVSADEHIRAFVRRHELITDSERIWAPEALRLHEAMLGLGVEEMLSKFLLDMLPPERDLYVKGGYDKIVEHVAAPVRESTGSLLLNHAVDEIMWGNGEGDATRLRVRFKDGPAARQDTLEADAVIVTVPLGVLKLDAISFEPSLPADLQDGLSRMSYGALGKVFFEFRDVFWSRHNDSLIYYPAPPELAEDSESKQYPVLGHCFIVTNLYMMTGTPRLCVLLAPPLVKEIEQLNASEGGATRVFEYFEPLLELFRTEPHEALPPLVDMKVTGWTSDELAGFGTYSTARVGDDPRVWWNAIDAHKGSRLQFAGEHCSRTATGCVHGAYETGEEAAIRILNVLGVSV
ncbi:hypothetical protein ACHAQA_001483 [Verticillium albo-atrum]